MIWELTPLSLRRAIPRDGVVAFAQPALRQDA
jgi:hypothetical protein